MQSKSIHLRDSARRSCRKLESGVATFPKKQGHVNTYDRKWKARAVEHYFHEFQ